MGGSVDIEIEVSTGTAGIFNGTLSIPTNDADENPFNFTIQGISASLDPDVIVFDGGLTVVDGVTNIDFGSTTVGDAVSKTFTVRNDGVSDLILGAIGAMPSGFTLTSGVIFIVVNLLVDITHNINHLPGQSAL